MWAAVVIVCVAAVFVLLLCVPVDMAVHWDIHGAARHRFEMRLVWLFGLVSREVRRAKPRLRKEKAVARRRPGFRQAVRGARTLIEVVRVRGIPGQAARLVRDVSRQLRFRHLEADVRIGLDDPADTGFLFAAVEPPLVFLRPVFPGRINIQPAFADPAMFDGYVHGVLRLQPIRLVVPVGRFVFSPAVFRLARTVLRHRWKSRT